MTTFMITLFALLLHPDSREVTPPAQPGAMAPRLSQSSEGVLLSWLEPVIDNSVDGNKQATSEKYRFCFSKFKDENWSKPLTIVEQDDFFANWADVPSVVQNENGVLVAHWLQESGEDTYAYDVMVARSADGGTTWINLGAANDDGTQTKHGFVSMIPESGGMRAFWLDGREMESADHGHGAGNMTVRTALITSTVGTSSILDKRVCECCSTSAALTSQGPVFVYRDRSADDTRDIAIVRNVKGQWTLPKVVHPDEWKISGCPVNGPVVAARENHLVVVWYTGAQFTPRVLAAFSSNHGETFGSPIEVDTEEPHGRVDALLNEDGSAIICWMADDHPDAILRLTRIKNDGSRGNSVKVTDVSANRASGFPTIALVDNHVMVVWTEVATPLKLRAVLVPLSGI